MGGLGELKFDIHETALLKTVDILGAMDQHCGLSHSICRPPSRARQSNMGETASMVSLQALFRPHNRFPRYNPLLEAPGSSFFTTVVQYRSLRKGITLVTSLGD